MIKKFTQEQLNYLQLGMEEEKNHDVKMHGFSNETRIAYARYLEHLAADEADDVLYTALVRMADFWKTYFEVSPLTAYADMLAQRKALENAGRELLEKGLNCYDC